MTTSECRKKSKLVLKGKYCEGFFVVMIFIVTCLIFKTLDIAKICFLLYNNNADTLSLFKTANIPDIFIKYLICLVTFLIATPLITGGVWWFYQTARGCDNKSILKLYTGFKLNFRALILYAIMWLTATLSLIPTGICFGLAGYIFDMAPYYQNQAAVLFISLQVFSFGIFLIGLYLKSMTSMLLAPFIFIKNPDKNVFKILNLSRKKIYGSKLECLKLILTYLPAMLPIVTIPFVLPKAIMSISIFACDRIGDKTWEN